MKRFLFLFFASLFTLSTWAYNISDDSTGSTIYYTIIEGTTNLEVTFSGDKYNSVVTYTGEVDIPASVTSDGTTYTVTGIGDSAFRSCSDVTKITLPETITSLGQRAFQATAITSMELGDLITEIGTHTFYNCTSLASVKLSNGMTQIVGNMFNGCESLSSIDIPTGVTSIGATAFSGCSSLKVVVLPDGVTSLGGSAFASCSALEEVNIPDGVTEIQASTFDGCSKLKSINLPEGCTSIARLAFNECTSLETIYSYNPEPPSIGASTTFGKTGNYVNFDTCILYVPAGCEEAYRAYEYTGEDTGAKVWNDFVNIVEMENDEGGSGDGDHEGDYLTPEIMGYDLSSEATSAQDITYSGAPSGTEYGAYTHVGFAGNDYEGDFNISNTKEYMWNNTSVGNLRKVIFEADERSTDSRTLSVRASNVPYVSTQKYSAFSSYGEEVGQISFPGGGTVTLSGDYEYFAIGFADEWGSSNIRFKSVELVWETDGGGDTGDQNFEYTVDPEEGTVTESFDVITLESEVMFVGTAGNGLIYSGTVNVYKDGDTEPYTTSKSIEGDFVNPTDAADTYLIITLEKAISEAGEYEVVIPAGTFYWFNNDNPVLNEEIILNYTFEGNSGTGDDGDHEGDYLTPEIMGFDMSSNSVQTIESYIGASGTEYGAYTHVGFTGNTYEGDFNVNNAASYIRNNTSVGYLRKLIIEPDERVTGTYVLPVRVSDEPYTGSTYKEFSEYGTWVADIVVAEGGTLEFSDNYKYFAVGAANNWAETRRFKAIELVWETEGGSNPDGSVPEGYIIEPAEGEVPSLSVITIDTEDGMGESSDFYNETKKAEFKVVNDDSGETVATLGSWEIMMDDNTYHTWVEIRLSNEVSEAGSYTVNIPEGVFLDIADYEYIPNPAFSIHYTVTGNTGSDYEIVVNPESGKTLESLSEFSITCADGMTVANWDDPLEVKKDEEVVAHAWGDISIQEGSVYIGYTFPLCGTDDQGSVTLTEAGTYTIHVPGEYFLLGDNDNVDEYNEEFDIVYIIGGGEPTGTYSYVVDPVEGQVESLSVIEFSSDDEDVDGFLGNYEYALYSQEALVYNRSERGEPITTATLESGGELDDYDSSIIITLKEEITEPGSYVVVIPEGSFYWIVDDEPILNEEIDLSYYIEAPQGEYTFDPADKSELTSLSEFTVYYEDGIDCSWNYSGEIVVTDEFGNEVAHDADCEPDYPDSWDEPTPSCKVILDTTIVADGTYTITIPEGYFVVGEDYLDSEELVITYTVKTDAGTETGIGGISINDENVEGIYSTSGQKLNKAQKGVNIIRYTDGSTKKVLISK